MHSSPGLGIVAVSVVVIFVCVVVVGVVIITVIFIVVVLGVVLGLGLQFKGPHQWALKAIRRGAPQTRHARSRTTL